MSASQFKAQRPRKAGGSGKKGKVFLENKSDLLSLMSSITSSKDAIVESKVVKQKNRTIASDAAAGTEGSQRGKEGGIKKSGKKAERAKALMEAKQKLLDRAKEKKARKKGKTDEEIPTKDEKVKKRVGFA